MHKSKKMLANAKFNEDCIDLSNDLMLSGGLKHFSIDPFQSCSKIKKSTEVLNSDGALEYIVLSKQQMHSDSAQLF